MSTPDSPKKRRLRRDGWTPDRQLRFLDALVSSRSVATAAASAGMSRGGAYRLRNRYESSLFALLWDRALAPDLRAREVHTGVLTNGQIMRLLGNHFRRKGGDFRNIGARKPELRRT